MYNCVISYIQVLIQLCQISRGAGEFACDFLVGIKKQNEKLTTLLVIMSDPFKNILRYSIDIVIKDGKKLVYNERKEWQKIKESQYNGEDSFVVLTGLTELVNNNHNRDDDYTFVICIDLDKKGNEEFPALKWFEDHFGSINDIQTLVTKTPK